MAIEEIDLQDILLNENDVAGAKLLKEAPEFNFEHSIKYQNFTEFLGVKILQKCTCFVEFPEHRTKSYRNCAFSENSLSWILGEISIIYTEEDQKFIKSFGKVFLKSCRSGKKTNFLIYKMMVQKHNSGSKCCPYLVFIKTKPM